MDLQQTGGDPPRPPDPGSVRAGGCSPGARSDSGHCGRACANPTPPGSRSLGARTCCSRSAGSRRSPSSRNLRRAVRVEERTHFHRGPGSLPGVLRRRRDCRQSTTTSVPCMASFSRVVRRKRRDARRCWAWLPRAIRRGVRIPPRSSTTAHPREAACRSKHIRASSSGVDVPGACRR